VHQGLQSLNPALIVNVCRLIFNP